MPVHLLIESGRNNLNRQRLQQNEDILSQGLESKEEMRKNLFPIKNMKEFKWLANELFYCRGCFDFFKEMNRGFDN